MSNLLFNPAQPDLSLRVDNPYYRPPVGADALFDSLDRPAALLAPPAPRRTPVVRVVNRPSRRMVVLALAFGLASAVAGGVGAGLSIRHSLSGARPADARVTVVTPSSGLAHAGRPLALTVQATLSDGSAVPAGDLHWTVLRADGPATGQPVLDSRGTVVVLPGAGLRPGSYRVHVEVLSHGVRGSADRTLVVS